MENSLFECGRPYNDLSCRLLYCPVASAESIHIVAGESTSERFRFDLFQDVPSQYYHMLTSGADVPGMAVGSDYKVRPIQTFLLP